MLDLELVSQNPPGILAESGIPISKIQTICYYITVCIRNNVFISDIYFSVILRNYSSVYIEAGVARAVALGGTGPVCALGTLYFSGDVREAFAKLNQ